MPDRTTLRALRTLALAVLASGPPAVPATAQQPPPPACEEVEGFHRLDFWIGEWDVVDSDGAPQGTNRIEKILSGCAILEHWEGAGGGNGKSLFYFDPSARIWKQVWVTSRATAVGAVKEKQMVETLPGGGVRFQGVIVAADGRSYLDRTTLRPLEDGRVEQVIEVSTDGGTEWRRTFTGIYIRRDS